MSFKTDFTTLPEGRFAWTFLDQPRTTDMNGKALDEPKYETMFYLPKRGVGQACPTWQTLYGLVKQVIDGAYRGQWPMANWEGWPIQDCDADAADLEKYPWSRGHWKIKLSGGKYAPAGYDAGNNKLDKDINGRFRMFKSGDFGMASINAYEWAFGNARKGVSFGIEAFKKTQDGEAIGGGGRPPEQIFGGPPGGGSAPPLPGPTPGGVYGGAPPPSPQQQPPVTGYAPQGFPTPPAAYPQSGPPAYSATSAPATPASGPYAPPGYAMGPSSVTQYPSSGMPPTPPFAPPPIGGR